LVYLRIFRYFKCGIDYNIVLLTSIKIFIEIHILENFCLLNELHRGKSNRVGHPFSKKILVLRLLVARCSLLVARCSTVLSCYLRSRYVHSPAKLKTYIKYYFLCSIKRVSSANLSCFSIRVTLKYYT